MKRPLQAGDMCEVISGSAGKASPNIGLLVIARQRVFECPQLGVIWRCEAEYADRLVLGPKCTCPPGMADFSEKWLRRLNDPAPVTSAARELETEK